MVAKNKVKPQSQSHAVNVVGDYNKKQLNNTNNLFKTKNITNTKNELKLIQHQHQNGGRIEKKYKKNNNKQQQQVERVGGGNRLRNNKVQDINIESNTNCKKSKTFDKKTWRLKKYSKKYKLQQWEEKRKKALLNEYYKQIKNDDDDDGGHIKKLDVKQIYNEYFDSDEERLTNPKINYVTNPNFNIIKQNTNNTNTNQSSLKSQAQETIINDEKEENDKNNLLKSPKKKLSAYHRAQLEYQRLQNEQKQKKQDILRQKAEREEALKKYKKNKMEKYKKLSKKTRKGQPIMKERMEMLLEKIQSTSV